MWAGQFRCCTCVQTWEVVIRPCTSRLRTDPLKLRIGLIRNVSWFYPMMDVISVHWRWCGSFIKRRWLSLAVDASATRTAPNQPHLASHGLGTIVGPASGQSVQAVHHEPVSHIGNFDARVVSHALHQLHSTPIVISLSTFGAVHGVHILSPTEDEPPNVYPVDICDDNEGCAGLEDPRSNYVVYARRISLAQLGDGLLGVFPKA